MFAFRNIDDFIPNIFERMGMLKGKRWYINPKSKEKVLFKPKRFEHGDKKVFCANHYGEFMGYLLARNAEVPVCRAELAHLSKYYSNIHKEKNHGTPEEKYGCISYNELESEDELEHGINVLDFFIINREGSFRDLSKYESRTSLLNDNIEFILDAIEFRVRAFYKEKGYSEDDINQKVEENKFNVIQMIVYDCLYGNNDRHDENWGLKINKDDIELYSLYDNERVLGLYENQNNIEKSLQDNKVKEDSEKILFSRMRIPEEKNKYSNYQDVLNYLTNNYKNQTLIALKKQLDNNTPEKVKEFLNSCENLPICYIDFATTMYESRYKFAEKLYMEKNKDLESNSKFFQNEER